MDIRAAKSLARTLIAQYGLTAWQFKWDGAVRRFGYCRFTTKTISMSKQLTKLNTEEKVRDTILHEIAHAIVGPGYGHKTPWKKVALQLGCEASACTAGVGLTAPYSGTCPNCAKVIHMFRRRRLACGRCCKKFNSGNFTTAYLFRWSGKGR